jgi:hypothetical protein
VAGNALQVFDETERKGFLTPVIELNQTNNPLFVPNGDQSDRSIVVMYALVTRMKPGIVAGG